MRTWLLIAALASGVAGLSAALAGDSCHTGGAGMCGTAGTCGTGAACGTGAMKSETAKAEVGQPAPDFAWKQDEETVHLTDLAAKNDVVAVAFWSTNCASCVAEMPKMNAMREDLAKMGVRVVAVNIALKESESTVTDWARKKGIGFPVIYDESKAIQEQFGITGPFQVALIDHTGIVQYLGKVPADMDARLMKLSEARSQYLAKG